MHTLHYEYTLDETSYNRKYNNFFTIYSKYIYNKIELPVYSIKLILKLF